MFVVSLLCELCPSWCYPSHDPLWLPLLGNEWGILTSPTHTVCVCFSKPLTDWVNVPSHRESPSNINCSVPDPPSHTWLPRFLFELRCVVWALARHQMLTLLHRPPYSRSLSLFLSLSLGLVRTSRGTMPCHSDLTVEKQMDSQCLYERHSG